MFVPFQSLPPSSRIWIYQADRLLSQPDHELIDRFLKNYCDAWNAHGQPLKASFLIAHNVFVILAVDETFNGASGCSIDTSVNAIREIAAQTGIDFFNRERIAFRDENIFFLPLKQLKEKFQSGVWNLQTLAFDNVIASKGQLDSEWLKPASETWLKRYAIGSTVKS